MVEVANLKIRYSADVENAMGGLKQVDQKVNKSATVAATESEKIEGFMGKWKMGWITMAAAGIASLYAVAKSSAVISGYFSEFGMIVGDVFDAIGIAMAPVIEPLLDFLWGLTDSFNALPEPVKAATGGVVLFLVALLTLIPILALLKTSLATLGVSMATISTVPLIGSLSVLGITMAGFLYSYWTNWHDTRDKVNAAIDTMKDKLSGFSPFAGNIFATIAKYPGILFTGKMILDPEQTLETLNATADAINTGWLKFKSIIESGINTIISKLEAFGTKWYNIGVELVNSIIRGIGDIGTKIWGAIIDGLSYVSTRITDWASGVLGFSPTLREIGAMVPKTLMETAGMMKITTPPIKTEYLMENVMKSTIAPMPTATSSIIEKTTVEKSEYKITVPITIKSGLSSDRELHELARKLKGHLMRELKDLGRG